jgi:lactoylglutathione lyase
MFGSAFVNLYSRDVEAGLRFYRDLLGFQETFRTPKTGTPTHVELKLDGFGLGLSSVEAAKRVHGVDAVPGSPVMSVVLWTPDLDQAFQRLTRGGAPVVQVPHDSGNNNRSALLRDPDGNLVEIVCKTR